MHEYQFTVSCPPCCIETIKGAFRSCQAQITPDDYIHVSIQNDLATVRMKQIKLKDAEVRRRLREAVEEIGFECKNRKKENHRLLGFLGAISGAGLMGLCLSGVALPFAGWVSIALYSTALTLILGKNIFARAAHNIKNLVQGKEKTLSMEVLLTLGSIIALGLSFCSLFLPGLPMTCDSALLILGFTHLGKAYKQSKNNAVEKELDSLSRPNTIVEALNAKSKYIKIAELKPGQTIRIYAGQTIPVDGTCLNKTAAVCKVKDTGDKNTVCPVKTGDELLAGWEIPQGQDYIDIRVDKEETQSTQAQLNKDYRLAQAKKNAARKKQAFEKIADLMTHYFVPCVLGIAAIAAVTAGILVSPLSALQAVTAIIASACPCTLGLIIPFAIKTALITAAADGICIKTEEGFELLPEINEIFFDWHGTLTTGELQVAHTNLKGENLAYLAALEGQSNHAFAATICEDIKKHKTPSLSLTVGDDLKPHHSGLMASIQIQGENHPKNIKYLTGNRKYLTDLGIKVDDYDRQEQINNQKKHFKAQHLTYFARQNDDGSHKILGHVLLRDRLRPDASTVIHELKKQGYKVGIISGGSSDEGLAAFAAEHQIEFQDNYSASAKKELIVKRKQEGYKTMMVGDSANDAFAMLESDFSIAIKSKNAHGFTEYTADAVIDPQKCTDPNKPLHPILNALGLAKRTARSIETNLAINLGYNLLTSTLFTGLLIGIGLAISPGISVALMFLQSAFILWNLKRMIKQKPVYANDPIIAPPQENMYQFACQSELVQKPKPELRAIPFVLSKAKDEEALRYGPNGPTQGDRIDPQPHTRALRR